MSVAFNRKKKAKKREEEVTKSVLAAMSKTFRGDLPFNSIPEELLLGSVLNLSQWTLLMTDKCLRNIAKAHLDSTEEVDNDAIKLKKPSLHPLLHLNISGAEMITDSGLQYLSKCSSGLQYLNLENSFQISENGLTAVTKRCQSLEYLSLSGCMGVSGAGFAILGQNCRQLVTLKLSGCRQITPWAFMKICDSCEKLRDLDISFCALVTDQEIKLLSESASELKKINLRECNQISDIGLTFLSQGCPNLADINLRRSDMPFRITDVALMQLGEACKSLSSLNLHGCEMISDTGLSWLSSWSKDLKCIDLSLCSKVTNSGIRRLAEGKSIVLSNVKLVSDVGVRYLANCCHDLESFNGSGLCKLSDGVNRPFGHEGLQSLGKSACAKKIRSLNLRGCFLLKMHALKSISNFSSLECLDLSGCTEITYDGASRIGTYCRKLTVLSLASCGDCINDSVVEALVKDQQLLRAVNLSFCQTVGNRSMKALSTCEKLQVLDVTSCIAVTDQSILHLSEGEYNPGIRDLLLAQCRNVGDTALSWIIDGLKQPRGVFVSLQTLSLKGTRITKSALKGIEDRFPFSVRKSNDSFFGFWPLSRINDRKVINNYHKVVCSAAKIQALIRSYREKVSLRLAKENHAKQKVAIYLGALFRGKKGRRDFEKLKLNSKRKHLSSMKLQCAFRSYLAKKRVIRFREKRWAFVTPIASTIIQSQWRVTLSKRKAEKLRVERLRKNQQRLEGSRSIQAWYRMLLAKRQRLDLLHTLKLMKNKKLQAAIIIQCAWRRYVGLKTVRSLRLVSLEIRRVQQSAATCIVASCKAFLLRREMSHRIARAHMRIEASLVIQNWYRTEKKRRWRIMLLNKQQILSEFSSAKLIQRNIRMRLAYNQLLSLRKERDNLAKRRQDKAIVLCRFGRMLVARYRMQRRRDEYDEAIKRAMMLRIWATTIIAAYWRGKLGRDKARDLKILRAQRWKALWSREEQRTFYYNKDTGQTSWEKPQCLLDLEPRPRCCNCDEAHAKIECADCEEYFCKDCFNFIHRGGRRKAHYFRPIYDYYGRRLDYDIEPWLNQVSSVFTESESITNDCETNGHATL